MATNFNIGYIEGKTSSRIIKPPGGSNSNIFDDERSPIRRKFHHPQTQIQECFLNNFDDDKKENGKQIETEPENEKVISENTVDNQENMKIVEEIPEPQIEKETVKPPLDEKINAAPQQRVRVPPGGFSSKLW